MQALESNSLGRKGIPLKTFNLHQNNLEELIQQFVAFINKYNQSNTNLKLNKDLKIKVHILDLNKDVKALKSGLTKDSSASKIANGCFKNARFLNSLIEPPEFEEGYCLLMSVISAVFYMNYNLMEQQAKQLPVSQVKRRPTKPKAPCGWKQGYLKLIKGSKKGINEVIEKELQWLDNVLQKINHPQIKTTKDFQYASFEKAADVLSDIYSVNIVLKTTYLGDKLETSTKLSLLQPTIYLHQTRPIGVDNAHISFINYSSQGSFNKYRKKHGWCCLYCHKNHRGENYRHVCSMAYLSLMTKDKVELEKCDECDRFCRQENFFYSKTDHYFWCDKKINPLTQDELQSCIKCRRLPKSRNCQKNHVPICTRSGLCTNCQAKIVSSLKERQSAFEKHKCHSTYLKCRKCHVQHDVKKTHCIIKKKKLDPLRPKLAFVAVALWSNPWTCAQCHVESCQVHNNQGTLWPSHLMVRRQTNNDISSPIVMELYSPEGVIETFSEHPISPQMLPRRKGAFARETKDNEDLKSFINCLLPCDAVGAFLKETLTNDHSIGTHYIGSNDWLHHLEKKLFEEGLYEKNITGPKYIQILKKHGKTIKISFPGDRHCLSIENFDKIVEDCDAIHYFPLNLNTPENYEKNLSFDKFPVELNSAFFEHQDDRKRSDAKTQFIQTKVQLKKWVFKDQMALHLESVGAELEKAAIELEKLAQDCQKALLCLSKDGQPTSLYQFPTLPSFADAILNRYSITGRNTSQIHIVENPETGVYAGNCSKKEFLFGHFLKWQRQQNSPGLPHKLLGAFLSSELVNYGRFFPDIEDQQMKTFEMFHGHRYHKCINDCYYQKKNPKHHSGLTWEQVESRDKKVFENASKKHPTLSEYQYKITTECQFDNLLKSPEGLAFKEYADKSKIEEAFVTGRLIPRNAFLGGLLDVTMKHFSISDFPEFEIKMFDINNAYGEAMANYNYPTSDYIVVYGEDIDKYLSWSTNGSIIDKRSSKPAIGLVKAKILPPTSGTQALFPFMMFRGPEGETYRALCRQCALKKKNSTIHTEEEMKRKACKCTPEERSFIVETTISEINYCIKLSYQLLKIFEAYIYPEEDTIFQPFIETLWKFVNQDTDIEKKKTRRKFMKKIICNGFGKLGAKHEPEKRIQVTSKNDLIDLISKRTNDDSDIIALNFLSDDVLEVVLKTKPSRGTDVYHNVILAAHITSYARQILYSVVLNVLSK